MREQDSFSYTYSAEQQEEVKSIRKKYVAVEEDKMERLRRLDRSVTKKGSAAALIAGITGALILGTGMSLFMTDLGEILGVYRNLAMPIGIILGILGIAVLAAAYPLYTHITKKERERIAPEILRLTEELMK